MRGWRRIWSVIFLSIILTYNIFSSDDVSSIKEEIAQLKARIAELEQKLSAQEENIKEIKEESKSNLLEGVSLGAGLTFVVQGTHNANGENLSSPKEDVSDASYSVDLELEKKIEDSGRIFLHLEIGDGEGVEDELQVFSNVNRDADDSDNQISLTEAFYEHNFKNFNLTFGKIDVTSYIDTNQYANDETTQFLGRIFRNSPVVDFPDNSLGMRFNFLPFEFLETDLVFMDTKSEGEDYWDSLFYAFQINLKPNFLKRQGNYRLYIWHNDKNYTSWKDSSKDKKSNYGVGISFDQELSDFLGVFLRYGWQNPKVYNPDLGYSLEHAISFGIDLKGNLWNRPQDNLGLAIGEIIPSDEYKKYTDNKGSSEEHLEIYYRFVLNDYLSLTPNIHIIHDPYGKDAINGDSTITVFGLRTQVDF